MSPAVQFCFYRTLYSQSAASVTVGTTAAALRAEGREAVLTLLAKGDHRSAEHVLDDAPDDAVLVLKPNFQDAAESLWLADELARSGRYRAVLLMGVYASGNAEHLIGMLPHVDGVVFAEPEAVLPPLVRAIAADPGWRFDPPPGVLTRDAQGRPLRSPAAPPVFDLGTAPAAARDVERREPARLVNLEASRGCIASCTFCHVPVVDRAAGAPRRRSRENADVVAEVAALAAEGKRYFVFNDPVFWSGPGDTERVRELARGLAALDEPVRFLAYLRTRPFPDDELLAELAAAGLVRAFIGVESHSPETLKLYRKGADADSYADIRAKLDRHGISHHIGFLVFHPFARLRDVGRDLDYLAENGQLHRIGVVLERSRLTPGTALLAQTGQAGLLTGERDPLSGDAAYSWRFTDPAVAAVHDSLARTFRGDLAGRHKFVEYHHTSSQFLRYLVGREPGGADPAWWREIDLLHAELSAVLHDHYRALVADAADLPSETGSAEALRSHRERGPFVTAMTRLERRTEVAAALLRDRVARSGHRAQVESLFTSSEGLR